MRYPAFLKPEGTIGFVAPSFGCNIEPYKTAFQNAQKNFTQAGYGLNLGPNCYAGEGIGISNTPQKCGSELTEYYLSEKNDILISCGGGELMCEILDYVDWEAIKQADPKWYMGFSDNTNMTFLLATICDVAAIYGPCAAAFGMEPWHPSLTEAMDVLTGKRHVLNGYDLWEKESIKDEEHPLLPYNVTEKRELHSFVPVAGGEKEGAENSDEESCELKEVTDKTVSMRGRLIGGCMDCLVNILGTKYDHVNTFLERYKDDGIVWFLESCDLNVMAIRRAMWQMEHAGWFEHVTGFVIGRPLCYGQEMMGLDQYKAVCDIIKKHRVPVIMDADIGHLAPMMPIVCGSVADIHATGNDLTIDMQYI